MEDKAITCWKCKFAFTLTGKRREQLARESVPEPSQCRECRSREQRLFKATCAKCRREVQTKLQVDVGKEYFCLDCQPFFEVDCDRCGRLAVVPFEPKEGRPVYCKSCLVIVKEDKQEYEGVCDNCGSIAKVTFKPAPGAPIHCADCFRVLGAPVNSRRVRPLVNAFQVVEPLPVAQPDLSDYSRDSGRRRSRRRYQSRR